MQTSFITTVKGGLPVMIDAERENGYWFATDIRWLGRKGKLGKSVPASIFDAMAANRTELDRINNEARASMEWEGV